MIDTHCHLFKEYYDNIDEIVNNMNDKVYGVIGIQPEEVGKFSDKSIKIIEDNINNPKIIGIGEVGLDYYWDDTHKEEQKKVFRCMMDLARKYKKTVVIHSREAIQDTYDIIKEYSDVKCVLHCYSSSVEMVKEFIKLGVMLGIGGVLTFKNSKKLVEVVKEIPLEYLLLETDSPYLSPEPFRGKTNIPNNIEIVAQKIAEIKDITVEEVLSVTTSNAKRQFNI